MKFIGKFIFLRSFATLLLLDLLHVVTKNKIYLCIVKPFIKDYSTATLKRFVNMPQKESKALKKDRHSVILLGQIETKSKRIGERFWKV